MSSQTMNVYIFKNYMETEMERQTNKKKKGIISVNTESLEAKEHTLPFGKSPGSSTIT